MHAVASATVPQALLAELEDAAIPYDLLPHARTTTAEAEALALGLPEDEVAKTVILVADAELVRVVVPATERVDLAKVRRCLHCREIALADERTLGAAYPEFELGAVPPLGGPHDPVVVDVHVFESIFAIVEAGTHESSLRLPSRDLVEREGALVADVC